MNEENMMASIELRIGGMTCDGCERSIGNALKRIPGVREVHADHRSGIVLVDTDRDIDKAVLDEAVDDAGYVVVPPGSSSLPMA